MADIKLSNPSNVPGSLYVDTTCIDCGTCFHLGPDIFQEQRDLSVVVKQPSAESEWSQAKAAIISCPTNSIGVKSPPVLFREVSENLPLKIQEDLYYCGYAARSSFGASTYLLITPLGNVLVDSPRFHPQLVKKIEELGGVRWMYLSHQDDVADHEKFAEHFKCTRIIHEGDLEKGTSHAEMILKGEGDWEVAPDLKIIFTPGHTKGHLCLLYKKYLFTGDHLFYSPELGRVYASQSVSWYSWPQQLSSIQKLLSYSFEWILPGHGGWVHKREESLKSDLKRII